jgi:carbohydrate diacid regulator
MLEKVALRLDGYSAESYHIKDNNTEAKNKSSPLHHPIWVNLNDIGIELELLPEEGEIPLEYEGLVIGAIKIDKENGRLKGTLDISASGKEMLLRRAFLFEEQQREEQAKELLVSLLLNQKGGQADPAVNMLARILGYDLEEPQAAFVVEFEKKDSPEDRASEPAKLCHTAVRIVENFMKFSGGFVAVSTHKDRVLVFKNINVDESSSRDLLNLKNGGREKSELQCRVRKNLISMAESMRQAILLGTKQDVIIGVGDCYRGLLAARSSYRDACLALKMGKYFRQVKQMQICHVNDFALESLLVRLEKKERERFVERFLGSIKLERDLQDTLEAFFQCNLNIAQAAEKMFLHRNTFAYRLDKIQQLTGLNPRSFYDAMVLATALIVQQVDCDNNVTE